MKAIQFSEFGGPEVLQWVELPNPKPKPSELLVEVHAASINPIDCKIREGSSFAAQSLALPSGLGFDVCGKVLETNGESAFQVGDEVFGLIGAYDKPQSYATHAIAKSDEVILKPKGLSTNQAAALPLAGLTAWQAVTSVAKLKATERVFILGGSGGVGHLAVQFAHAIGAEVFTTANTAAVSKMNELGADTVIDHTKEDFEQICKDMDVVIDLVGGAPGGRSLNVLQPSGRLVTVPTFSRDEIVAAAEQKGLTACGMLRRGNLHELQEMTKRFVAKECAVMIAKEYPMRDASLAHKQLQAGGLMGKVLLRH